MPALAVGVKSAAHVLLAAYGWAHIRYLQKPTLLILTYHRVLPTDHPERSSEQPGMVLSPEILDQHILLLKRLQATFIHLDDWLDSPELRPEGLAVAVTFDDGWKDNFDYAYPVLRRHEVPATIFLATAFIGTRDRFWPEQILERLTSGTVGQDDPLSDLLKPYVKNYPIASRALTPQEADEVVEKLKALPDSQIYAALSVQNGRQQESGTEARKRNILNADELRAMGDSNLVRYGTHTRNHYRLDLLEKAGHPLSEEVVGCIQDVLNLGIPYSPIFCYPNGSQCEGAERLVRQHYAGACTTSRGWNHASSDPYSLKRINLHDGNSHSPSRFFSSIARGLL
ncbi:polysaccharide deacetylase family protein [Marinobacter pelagius]|uniref:polysaccharide deacetylase family protein n=1 Tax=Marinobacter sp. C7 TaxID=2951363 RepID=UPI001EF00BF8|nr:polysaccharide deacetylase family protein [Marinobacter sp. C7]MCG7199475.1 polysaccharide deacetylase family protein [Marinobacter sp. C7]